MPGLAKYALRDGAIVFVTLVLFVAAPQSAHMQVVLGALLGACAYLFHEWAHLIGALVAGARIDLPANPASPFLFSFDSSANSPREFLHMTWPGFLATAVYITLFLMFLPRDETWGIVALGIGLLLTTATIVIEGPIALWVLIGEKYQPSKFH